MKKLIIIAVTLFMATNVFAQEIVEVTNVEWKRFSTSRYYTGRYLDFHTSRVYFSDGSCIYYNNIRNDEKWQGWWNGDAYNPQKVSFPVTLGSNIIGQKFQKRYNSYTRVSLQKVGTYTIKKVSVHDVNSEFTASMKADFSYRSFLYRRASGSASGSAKGGTRTIVNIFFENGKKATIEASSDPIWLDAEPGMQVEHYRIGDKNFYNLL